MGRWDEAAGGHTAIHVHFSQAGWCASHRRRGEERTGWQVVSPVSFAFPSAPEMLYLWNCGASMKQGAARRVCPPPPWPGLGLKIIAVQHHWRGAMNHCSSPEFSGPTRPVPDAPLTWRMGGRHNRSRQPIRFLVTARTARNGDFLRAGRASEQCGTGTRMHSTGHAAMPMPDRAHRARLLLWRVARVFQHSLALYHKG